MLTGMLVWLSRRGATLPGIVPLFPTFAIVPLMIVGAKGSSAGFKEASLAGMKTIPAYVAFAITCYFAVDHVDYRLALGAGLVAWLAVASAIFLGPRWL